MLGDPRDTAIRLRHIEDRQEIADKLHLYCRALDRVDENLLRSAP